MRALLVHLPAGRPARPRWPGSTRPSRWPGQPEIPHLLTAALGHRAAFKGEAGDLDAAPADHQEVLALARASGDNYILVVTLVNLGVDQVTAGEFPAALAYLQEALRVADAHGYQHLAAAVEVNLGFAYLMDARCRQCPPPARRRPGHGASHQ